VPVFKEDNLDTRTRMLESNNLIVTVPLVKQELLTLVQHLVSPSVFSSVSKFILCPFFF
jgi:hypothetical protein